jgi:hypothetical protein
VLAVLAIGALLLSTVPPGDGSSRASEIEFDRVYSGTDLLGTVLIGAALAAGTALVLRGGRLFGRSSGASSS